ncbi:PTS sugar transporter subunit IIB [Breznakia pachnodae]|uniref:PTS system cellobiose-specific IIB component n=1 Tax=Breznakia pachnodae TaxID=265178 RepID=A0ABU0E2D7_9FIRM|nr:PTS sugar transporter subunit IIB [Breznakia pachnodae]MDQ0361051.1 PTS system cellobiose-specific IIB component [Breznakia pachnodae]
MRIMLACALGMSTGMLVERMREEAAKQGKEYKIWAVDTSSVDKYVGEFDILLLGPQVAFAFDEIKEKYDAKTPVAMIKPVDYGRMNGASVLKEAEELYNSRK